MHKSQLTLLSTLIALVTLGLCGCNNGSTPSAKSSQEPIAISPPAGSSCSVHFRRNLLGVASANPIQIDTGNHNGADIIISGIVVKMDGEWLVLKTGDNTEKWVPRNVIFHMTVNSR